MKQAEKEGKLYRERQFMVGIPASEMGKGLQSEERGADPGSDRRLYRRSRWIYPH